MLCAHWRARECAKGKEDGGAGKRGVARAKKHSSLFVRGPRKPRGTQRHAAAPRSAVTHTHTTGTHARVPGARVHAGVPPFLLFVRVRRITPMPSSPTPDDPLSQLAASADGGTATNAESGRVSGRGLVEDGKGRGWKEGAKRSLNPFPLHTGRTANQRRPWRHPRRDGQLWPADGGRDGGGGCGALGRRRLGAPRARHTRRPTVRVGGCG